MVCFIKLLLCPLFLLGLECGCNKTVIANHPPSVQLYAGLQRVDSLFTYRFSVTTTDQDLDPLTFLWDFGEGTIREGGKTEIFAYAPNTQLLVKVKVSDGNSEPVTAIISINTEVTEVTIDKAVRYQVMEGFGGFGAQDVYWSNGPFTSQAFVNAVVNDLGITIIRDELPTSFELTNDNTDPYITDLSKFNLHNKVEGHHLPLGARLEHLKALKAAGVRTFIASVWSPPPWMKYNNRLDNGTSRNSAPPFNPNPDAGTNQLRTDLYQEFAEMCIAYVRILKQEAGIDLYALSIQNEPRFSQSYQSCVYNGAALHNLLKVVGERFKAEGLHTKLFLPEDIGWLDGVKNMIMPSLQDPETRKYVDILAVHGYDFDGVTAASPDAQTWQTMYGWGAAYQKPLWMTETSGFKNDYAGAMSLAKAMYTAIRFGQVSAWVFWTISTSKLDEYCLMSSQGVKSKRFYVSKNFYRFIRPGAVRIKAEAEESSKIYPLAFYNQVENSETCVFINDHPGTSRPIRIKGTGFDAGGKLYITSETENCQDHGEVSAGQIILLPANSVVTLYKKN